MKTSTPQRKAPPRSPRRAALLAGLALLLVLAAAAAWLLRGGARAGDVRLSDRLAPGDARGYNLLLVTLDTVRWDHIGCYGSTEARTPHIDALMGHGFRFDQAIASTPLTLPSHATILTGLYPPAHGARDNGRYIVGPEVESIAEAFRDAGYRTGAFVGCFVLDRRYGLDQGFDAYDFRTGSGRYRPSMVDFNERSATEVSDAAIAWLRDPAVSAGGAPFFLWVHYFDPHLPYLSPLQERPEFLGRPYDAEIAYADQELGRLLAELDRLGARERTLVLLVADHGESLGEHEEATHGMFLYESTLRVPFLLSCPGLFTGPSVAREQLAGLVDVAPTVRSLFGLPAAASDGLDLLQPEAPRTRALYLETLHPYHSAGWSPLYGLRTPEEKLIRAPVPELYDLAADPRELRNLYARSRSAERLERELSALQELWADAPDRSRELDAEERERLASLGYVSSAGDPVRRTLADPKSMMGLFNDGARAEELYMQGRYAEASEIAARVVADCDGCVQAIRVLAFARLRMGDPQAGIDLLRERGEALGDLFLQRSLAQALILTQRFAEAGAVLDAYAALAPRDGEVWILRGDILVMQQRTGEARQAYQRAAEIDPVRVGPMAADRLQRLEAQ